MSKKRDTWTAARYAAVREAAEQNSRKVIPDNGPSGPHDPPKPQPTAAAPDHSASVAAHVERTHAEAIQTAAALFAPANPTQGA